MQSEDKTAENFENEHLLVQYKNGVPDKSSRAWNAEKVKAKLSKGEFTTKIKDSDRGIGLSGSIRKGNKLFEDVRKGAVYIDSVNRSLYTFDGFRNAIFGLLWSSVPGKFDGLIPNILATPNGVITLPIPGLVSETINPGDLSSFGGGINYMAPNAYIEFMVFLSHLSAERKYVDIEAIVNRLVESAAASMENSLRNLDPSGYHAFLVKGGSFPVRLVGAYPYAPGGGLSQEFYTKVLSNDENKLISFLTHSGVGGAFARDLSLFYRKVFVHYIIMNEGINPLNLQFRKEQVEMASVVPSSSGAAVTKYKASMSVNHYVQAANLISKGVKLYVPSTKTFVDSVDMYNLVKPREEFFNLVVEKTLDVIDKFHGIGVESIPDFQSIDITGFPNESYKLKDYNTTDKMVKISAFQISYKRADGQFVNINVPKGLLVVSPASIRGKHIVGGETAIETAMMALRHNEPGFGYQSAHKIATNYESDFSQILKPGPSKATRTAGSFRM